MLYLIRYGEIALKGKNRKFFVDTLTRNIKESLQGLEARIISEHSRIFVEVNKEEHDEEVKHRLQRVFGIVSLSPVSTADLSVEDIQERALELLQSSHTPPFTFKVETRRANKSFSYTSPEMNKMLGAYLLKNMLNNMEDISVDVHNPDVELFVEIRGQEAYLFLESYPGPGGLPLGVSGKGLLLLSGGIDSPVAGWLCMKRGLQIEAVHFHSYPFTSERSKEKVKELAQKLAEYSSSSINLHVIPFTEIQKEIQLHCPKELSITVMRRMMFRLGRDLAQILRAQVLITGESLGQVASQTIENMHAASIGVDLPVFRPLLGMDKQEIINKSQTINTYDTSIKPYEDCCTVFLPEHPVTRPKLSRVNEIEQNLDVDALIEKCLHNYETFTFKLTRQHTYI